LKLLYRLLFLCFLSAMMAMTAAVAADEAAPALSAEEEQAVALLNADRTAEGLAPLRVNLSLAALARDYAQDMIDRGYFAHASPEGEEFTDRLARYGIVFRSAGENLGMHSSVAAAERMLMNSPGHRANILSKDFSEVGIGIGRGPDGTLYVVQVFVGR
jgi:uncharacterized protein YkwD